MPPATLALVLSVPVVVSIGLVEIGVWLLRPRGSSESSVSSSVSGSRETLVGDEHGHEQDQQPDHSERDDGPDDCGERDRRLRD